MGALTLPYLQAREAALAPLEDALADAAAAADARGAMLADAQEMAAEAQALAEGQQGALAELRAELEARAWPGAPGLTLCRVQGRLRHRALRPLQGLLVLSRASVGRPAWMATFREAAAGCGSGGLACVAARAPRGQA